MKKISAVMLLLVFLLTGCQTNSSEIPLILYNEVDPYILEFKDNIFKYSKDVLDIKSYDSQNSQLLQNEIIENVLEDNPSVLIINPVDRLGAYTIIDKVKEDDIPIIFINREPLKKDMNSWTKLYYIGAPAENSAILQSEMIHEIFGSPNDMTKYDLNGDNIIQLVLLKGEQGHQDAEIRSEVVIEELENIGYELDILSIEICDWQEEIAKNHVDELMKNIDQTIELVISNNDAMAIGAVESLLESGLFEDTNEDGYYDKETEPWIPVIGIDGIQEAFSYIDNGLLYGTVINDSEEMSKALIELVDLLQKGEDISNYSYEITNDKYIWIDYKKYEKENGAE